jgi:hypothetical protein
MPDRAARFKTAKLPVARAIPQQRETAAERGYGSRWQKARLTFLADNPLCVKCREAGRYVEAVVVDHIVPHRGSNCSGRATIGSRSVSGVTMRRPVAESDISVIDSMTMVFVR